MALVTAGLVCRPSAWQPFEWRSFCCDCLEQQPTIKDFGQLQQAAVCCAMCVICRLLLLLQRVAVSSMLADGCRS